MPEINHARLPIKADRILSPHRGKSLNRPSPGRRWRDELVEPAIDLAVDTVAGSRPLVLLVAELDR